MEHLNNKSQPAVSNPNPVCVWDQRGCSQPAIRNIRERHTPAVWWTDVCDRMWNRLHELCYTAYIYPAIVQYVHLFIYYTSCTEIHTHTPMATLHHLWGKIAHRQKEKKEKADDNRNVLHWNLLGQLSLVDGELRQCRLSISLVGPVSSPWERQAGFVAQRTHKESMRWLLASAMDKWKCSWIFLCWQFSKRWMQFLWKLTRIELRCRMVARFTKLPAATPWVTRRWY